MPVYDISGPIREGIWKYGDAYPDFCLEHTSAEPGTFFFEIFHGMNSQTGVYLETTAHVNGYETGRMLSDVPVSALVNIPCRVLHLDRDALAESGGAITLTILQKAMEGLYFPEGCAILFEAGWDDWYAPEFLDGGPWLTRESMAYLLSKKPSLMGSDTSAWQNEEPVFDLFAATDTLLLAPLVGLDKVPGKNGLLTVLPILVEGTCCAPARAVIVEE